MLCSFSPDFVIMITEKYDNLMNRGDMLLKVIIPFMMARVASPN
jgi:hypothetical protein